MKLTALCLLLSLTAPALGADPVPPATPASAPADSQPATRPSQVAILAAHSLVRTDLPYISPATEKQCLDVYAPKNVTNAPVIVYVHGGEWARGDKSEVSFKPRFLNENGIIFVSVNYRLSATDKYPAQVNDIAAAIRWVKEHISEFNGDPNNITLVGHSAGCHLVAMIGLDPRPLATAGLKPTDLRGVVSWSGGAFDLPAKVKEGGMYAKFIRINFGEDDPKAWSDASPINHIHDTREQPPFLFVSAGDGNSGSRLISDEMVARINSAGGHARAIVLPGKTHFTSDYEVGKPGDETGTLFLQFIDYTAMKPKQGTAP